MQRILFLMRYTTFRPPFKSIALLSWFISICMHTISPGRELFYGYIPGHGLPSQGPVISSSFSQILRWKIVLHLYHCVRTMISLRLCALLSLPYKLGLACACLGDVIQWFTSGTGKIQRFGLLTGLHCIISLQGEQITFFTPSLPLKVTSSSQPFLRRHF